METPVEKIIPQAAEDLKSGKPFVLATVVEGAAGTPGRSGFKMLVYADGSIRGTVGGGKLERMVLDDSLELHKTGGAIFRDYQLTETGIGMQCGGIARVFLEYFSPVRRVFIFGAGHLCRSLLPLVKSLGFYTVVIDNRVEFANRSRLPEADEVIPVDYNSYLEHFTPARQDAVVIFTHGHEYDFDILDLLCRKNIEVKYIGMIGSGEKVRKAIETIKGYNYKGGLISRIYAPIGLNIGKGSTQEIAVAVAAEILAVYNNVDQITFLKDKGKIL